jgi:Ca2+-binding RTX toxin-like protein
MGEVTECDVIVVTNLVASVKNIRGGAGDDTLIGDNRANIIWGGAGNDTIDGAYGNDALYGEAGDDNIRGGPDSNASSPATTDDDYINGGTGTNHLYGGDGLDTIDSSLGASDVVDCGAGDGDISLPSNPLVLAVANCEF